MFFFKKRKNEEVPKERNLITSIVGLGFDFLKGAIKDFEQTRQIKKVDKFHEHLSTIEHLILKLENKLDENRREVEKLKSKLFFAWLSVVGLLGFVIFNLFY